jgi:SpoIIAA-like
MDARLSRRRQDAMLARESATKGVEVEVLTLLADLPDAVVGVEARGRVTAEDYARVLVPAVEAARGQSGDGRVRLLYVLGRESPDYTAGAAWEDTKLGLGHLRSWERIAVVGDADWLRHAIHGLGWIVPGEVRVFGTDELDSAREWVTSPLPGPARLY